MTYSQQELIAKRVWAICDGRAQRLTDSFLIGEDPAITVGLVPLKVVTEEQVQAIGYGRIDQPPAVISRSNPLSREVDDLIPFARWLCSIGINILAGAPVRFWAPHRAAIECLDVLGHRYATNQEAPPEVQQMGRFCRAIAGELMMSDQPIVACSLELLAEHFITGQSPAEDRNLGSFLTWLDPPAGVDVVQAAREAARLPSASILPNVPGQMDDAEVTRLRRQLKKLRGTQYDAAFARMRVILERAVLREWDMMLSARQHLLSLPNTRAMPPEATQVALQRVAYKAGGGPFKVAQPHAVATELKKHERSTDAATRRAWRDDPRRRAAAIRRGRLLHGTLQVIVPATGRGTKPRLLIATNQKVLRSRVGESLHLLDSQTNFVGRVIAVNSGAAANQRIVHLELTTGLRSLSRLIAGTAMTWEPHEINLLPRETMLATHIRDRAPWLLNNTQPPSVASIQMPSNDLLALANSLERSS